MIQSIVFTRKGTERIIRYAFEYARQHGRKKVTSATKSNSMRDRAGVGRTERSASWRTDLP